MKTPRRSITPKKILVMDDDSDILEMVVQLLKSRGYAVASACNPAEFQTAFDAAPLPHLVLLDVRMPIRDGFGIAEEIRSKFNIPIIFMTAHDCPKYRLYAPIVGAVDYIQKPFDPDQLISAVEKAIGPHQDAKTNDWLLGSSAQRQLV